MSRHGWPPKEEISQVYRPAVPLIAMAASLAACATQAQMQGQAISQNTTSAVSQFQACANSIVGSTEYAPIRTKLPLDSRKATLEQLTDTSKVTPVERTAILKSYAMLQACRQDFLATIERTTPTVVPIFAEVYAKNDMLLVRLLEKKISFGEEVQLAKQLSIEAAPRLTAEIQRIDAGLQQSHEAELQRRQQAAAALAAYAQQQQIIDNMNRPTLTNCNTMGNVAGNNYSSTTNCTTTH